MHPSRVLIAVSLTLWAAASAAAGPQHLFTLDSTTAEKSAQPPASRKFAPDAVEELPITVDPAAVAANPPSFLIDLPGHSTLEALRTRFVSYQPDWKSWTGTLRPAGGKGPGAGYIHLGYHGDQMTAVIHWSGERFQIVRTPGGHRLARLSDDLSPLSCGVVDRGGKEAGLQFLEEPAASPPAGAINKVATNRIDVLAVYPTEFFYRSAAEENGLLTFIRDSISLANDAFTNSGVDAAYNLVGIVPLTGAQPPSTGQLNDLVWMTGGGGTPVQTDVASLRTAFGADVVALFTPLDWRDASQDYCGIANEPLANNSQTGSPQFMRGGRPALQEAMGDRAFSVHRNSCGKGDFTLGHEIGHNYGMRHDDTDTHTEGDVFSYAQGITFYDPVVAQSQATVMACFCTGCFCYPLNDPRHCPLGTGAVCNRIPYFSDSARTYHSVALGDANHDNSRVARNQVATYAGFRPPSTNTPPTASFTVSCSGRTCTFNGASSTDNAGISSYWWDFGDHSTPGSGQVVSHPYDSSYTTGTSIRAHLVVTDTGGQTNAVAGTATITPTYEGYHEVANCRSLSGWAWDQNNPNSPINVDIYRDLTLITSVSANAFRSDLQSAGKGNGYHGFGYTPSSSWKDGQWHAARVRFPGTFTNLTWSPINIICGVTCFPSQTPVDNVDTAGQVYTVATQISSSQNGYITHLRFYRAAGETGTNVGKLWTDGGSLLASVTFPSSPSSGWVEAALSSPVAITANVNYRVSVNTNTHQSKTNCGIGSGITNQVLTAHQGFWIAGNVFPTTASCSNFFVDVKFDI